MGGNRRRNDKDQRNRRLYREMMAKEGMESE